MNWESLSDFIHMGGHGYYVWVAYGSLIVGVIAELYLLKARRQRITNRLIREARAHKSTLEM